MSLTLLLSLTLSAAPCAPFAPAWATSPGPRRLIAAGRLPDGTVLVVDERARGEERLLRADLFAHQLHFVSAGAPGFRLPDGRSIARLQAELGVAGTKLEEVEGSLRAELARWPVVSRVELEPLYILRGQSHGWLVVARQVHDTSSPERLFTGRGSQLAEVKVMGFSFSLGGLKTLQAELDGRLVTLKLQTMYLAQLPPALFFGEEQLETLDRVSALPGSLRFSCLEPLPSETLRWAFQPAN